MKLQIKNRWTGDVIFKCEAESVFTLVKLAIESKTDLSRADLSRADLGGANLEGANLEGADLRSADLRSANLRSANLRSANLRSANLEGADLRSANLEGANLEGADLCSADLEGANLEGADLCSADLIGAKNIALPIARTRILPEGDLIVWKKCRAEVLVKLLIPSDAKRSHAFGRKCRAEFAKVLEVIGAEFGTSKENPNFFYRVGEVVKPDSFDPDFKHECSNGIHFFITREEAEAY